MTCPWKDGTWFLSTDEKKQVNDGENFELEYDNSKKDTYYCKNATTKYYFYAQGKACKQCYELNADLFFYLLLGDMVFTVGLMIVIYKCTKKNSSGQSPHASYASSRSGGQAPPIPNPDYEPLNPHTRNQETYSGLRSAA